MEKMYKVEIIMNPIKFDALKDALNDIGIDGMTVTNALGCGHQKGHKEYYRGVAVDIKLLNKLKVEIVICEVPLEDVIDTINYVLRTGAVGDGKIFIYELYDAVRIRTGDRGPDAVKSPKN